MEQHLLCLSRLNEGKARGPRSSDLHSYAGCGQRIIKEEERLMSVTIKKTLLEASSDFYALGATISEEDQALLRRTRDFLEAEVAPVINDYWIRAKAPAK